MIEVGQRLPSTTLYEYLEVATPGCTMGPNAVDGAQVAAGKTILLIGVPGAFTPTCAGQHLPGYLANVDQFRAKGVDELWCVAVNDAFVMHAWGKGAGVDGRVRMLADGSAQLANALGLTLDLTARGMGVRVQRFAMVLRDGVVTDLQVEAPGKFEVSKAENMLARL